MRGRLAPLLLAAALAAAPARATPSIWQRAQRPAAGAQQAILNRIERLLGSLGLTEFDGELSAGAIALAQLGQPSWPCLLRPGSLPGAAPPTRPELVIDARLEYLIGEALLDSQ